MLRSILSHLVFACYVEPTCFDVDVLATHFGVFGNSSCSLQEPELCSERDDHLQICGRSGQKKSRRHSLACSLDWRRYYFYSCTCHWGSSKVPNGYCCLRLLSCNGLFLSCFAVMLIGHIWLGRMGLSVTEKHCNCVFFWLLCQATVPGRSDKWTCWQYHREIQDWDGIWI